MDSDMFEMNGVLVTLHVDDKQRLFVMLTSDGTIRRSGDGSESCDESDLFIGGTDGGQYRSISTQSATILDRWLGQFSDPKALGKRCKLVLGFKSKDGSELVSVWEYGTSSQGPPPEICTFVKLVVTATDSWYQSERARVTQAL
jgi:hypothetical protein